MTPVQLTRHAGENRAVSKPQARSAANCVHINRDYEVPVRMERDIGMMTKITLTKL